MMAVTSAFVSGSSNASVAAVVPPLALYPGSVDSMSPPCDSLFSLPNRNRIT